VDEKLALAVLVTLPAALLSACLLAGPLPASFEVGDLVDDVTVDLALDADDDCALCR